MTFIGLTLCCAAVVAFDNGLYHLMRTGTCASGGPYVTRAPCPPGTGLHILSLVGGIFAGLIGIGLYAARGAGDKDARPSPVPLGAIMWCLLFCTIAGVSLLVAFGPANNDDDGIKTMAVVFGLVFIPMGLAPVPLAFLGRRTLKDKMDLVQHGKRCPGVITSVEDTGVTVNDNPHVKFTVRAEPPGEAPFTIQKSATVSRVKIPREGDKCTVFYDPADRENKNGISFDFTPGAIPSATSALLPPSSPLSTAAVASEDNEAIEKLERLGKLKASGVLTEAEFQEQKKKLLDEL
jgi:hypothetical protein